jgi:SAM-dependent methyltransferase
MPGRSAGAAAWDARLSVPGSPVCAPDWLALREPADAAARSVELAELLTAQLQAGGQLRAGAQAAAGAGPGAGAQAEAGARPVAPIVVRDVGCGTGSMARWLAGRLPGPQHWVLHDRDPVLLARAEAAMPQVSADGAPVTARTHEGDLADLRPTDLAGTALVTASALLDMLTSDEVDALVAACVEAGCAALLTLTVAGRVEIAPSDPLEVELADAFDAHQRRCTGGRRLLGPDAGPAAAEAFRRRGAAVEVRPSPWYLGAGGAAAAELVEEWLRGWIGAACAQRPDLERYAGGYLRRRLDAVAAGALRVEVGHVDVLALPAGAGVGRAPDRSAGDTVAGDAGARVWRR